MSEGFSVWAATANSYPQPTSTNSRATAGHLDPLEVIATTMMTSGCGQIAQPLRALRNRKHHRPLSDLS
jgi:hypothetical protein